MTAILRYLTLRLDDQLSYYRKKASRRGVQLKRLQWVIYIAGGAGTLLAALGLELWIALTTALASALATFLGSQQIESIVIKYSQAATDLDNVKAWWAALSAVEQAHQDNQDRLVDQTETTLQKEHADWIQQMEDAMAELQAQQPSEKPPSDNI